MISKSLSTSERFGGLVALGPLAEFAQLLYPLLVVHADDFGRLPGDAFTVKLTCLPVSPRPLSEFATALEQLDRAGLIAWYVAEGKRYIEIRNFEWHQRGGLHKRTRSGFPEIPGDSGNVPEVPGNSRLIKENLREEKYEERAAEILGDSRKIPEPRTVEPDATPLQMRAGKLVERYAELFYQHRKGARYHSRLHLDFQKACDLVRTWADDARLEKLAVIVLTTDDDWVARTDRGFAVFAARATWADDRLRAWEIEHQVQT